MLHPLLVALVLAHMVGGAYQGLFAVEKEKAFPFTDPFIYQDMTDLFF